MTVTSCLLALGWASSEPGQVAKLDRHSGRHPADLRRADFRIVSASFVTNRTPQRNILILCGISDVVGATASHRSDSPYRRESVLWGMRKSQRELNRNIVYFRSPAAAKLGVALAIRVPPTAASTNQFMSVTAGSGNLRSTASIAAGLGQTGRG